MDPRSRRTAVTGPKVRQVGFVTPGTDGAAAGAAGAGAGAAAAAEKEVVSLIANSPTPVMIPPTTGASRPPPTIEVPQKPAAAEPVTVPSPSHRRGVDLESIPSAPIGSYNSVDPFLEGSSPLLSSKGGALRCIETSFSRSSNLMAVFSLFQVF